MSAIVRLPTSASVSLSYITESMISVNHMNTENSCASAFFVMMAMAENMIVAIKNAVVNISVAIMSSSVV